jgi:GMP synthase (glutamine-hydrolysing) A subunit
LCTSRWARCSTPKTAFYRDCFQAFQREDLQVILSVGANVSAESLGKVPANFIVQSHVPQLDVLRRATVFVTHGGMNSVNEGLYHGVPLLVVPQMSEQAMVGRRVEELGAGIYLAKEDVTAERLRGSVRRLLSEDGFRLRAQDRARIVPHRRRLGARSRSDPRIHARSGLEFGGSCYYRYLNPKAQIAVLDAGGQYCHLIARKVRDLGVYAEVRASETPAAEFEGVRGIIISGGPSSVYDPGSPTVDPAIFDLSIPVLGICYGQQVMAHLLGGHVRKGDHGEYGLATLQLDAGEDAMFAGVGGPQQVWMSHRDVVDRVPEGFRAAGSTATCEIAAMADARRNLYAVQYHLEVVHTPKGNQYLSNFVFDVCGCRKDWDPRNRLPVVEQEIRDCVGNRNVFFFVSGGVDSTVAFTLCTRALGADRVRGVYVDTGLMREGETDFVRRMGNLAIEHAEEQFLTALAGATDPEQKRHIIGEEFVKVQERIIEARPPGRRELDSGSGHDLSRTPSNPAARRKLR